MDQTAGMQRRSIVIDTDTASDDAVALVLAVREATVDVRAVTVVAGNVPLDLAVRNAIVTLDLCGGVDIPVHAGLAEPMARALNTAQFVHGADGMGGAALPDRRAVTSDDAVEALLCDRPGRAGSARPRHARTAHQHRGGARVDPDFLTKFGHTYLMAGSPDGVGNIDALGEYNVWADPEAATVVFAAPGAKTIIGWNISRLFAVMNHDEQAQLARIGALGKFAIDINGDVDQYAIDTGLGGFDLPDPIAMAVALDESIVTEATHEWLVVGLDGPTREVARSPIAASVDPIRTSACSGASMKRPSRRASSPHAPTDRLANTPPDRFASQFCWGGPTEL